MTHESIPINIVAANIRDKDIRSSKSLSIIIDDDKISDNIGDFEYSQQP